MMKTIHVVGGAVRDRLLALPLLDIDLILPVDPAPLAKKVAAALGGASFPLDEERGIVRVKLPGGIHLDFARWQGRTLEEDIDRRDFTINAMAVPLGAWMTSHWKEAIIDRHKGLSDLQKKRIIPLNNHVFKEDPLRLLRAFRIAAELDCTLPPATLSVIKKNAKLIRKPAPERKREELLRTFATPRAYKTLVSMDQSRLLDMVFPEAPRLRRTAVKHYGKGGVLRHTLDSVKCFEEIVADKSWFPGLNGKIQTYLQEKMAGHSRLAHCKWGLLLHDIGKPDTMKIMDGRLRFFEHEHVGAKRVGKLAPLYRWSGDETSRYENFVRHHMRPGNLAVQSDVSDKAIHRFFRDLGDDAVAMLLVSLGDHLTYLTAAQRKKRHSAHEKTTIKMIRRFYTQREKVVPPRLINGHEIMKAFNLKPSPVIGALMADLNEAQSEGKIHTKADALAYLKGRLSWHKIS